MKRDILGVIFDLDGVIADSHPLHEDAWQQVLKEAGSSLSPAEVAAIIREGRTRAEMLQKFFPGVSQEVHNARGRRKDELFSAHFSQLQPIPGVIPWIRNLAQGGVPLAIATSASPERAHAALEQFGIETLFRAVVTSRDVIAGKPDPALFQAAARELGIAPQDLLVVEDSEAGLTAAHSAGMRCLFFRPDERQPALSTEAPEFQITAFTSEQLTPVIKRVAAR